MGEQGDGGRFRSWSEPSVKAEEEIRVGGASRHLEGVRHSSVAQGSRGRRPQALDDRSGHSKGPQACQDPLPTLGQETRTRELQPALGGGQRRRLGSGAPATGEQKGPREEGTARVASDVAALSSRWEAAGRRYVICARRTPSGLTGHLPSIPS